MINFLIALSGGLGIGAAALAICYGYRADTYRQLGYNEEASKYYKIFGVCIGYILLWVISALVIHVVCCK